MKRTICLILAVCAIAFSFSACGDKTAEDSGKIKIISTIFPGYDFARAIAGDRADVQMLLSPGGEAHSYDPSLSDLSSIKSSDVFIYVGGESDEWVNDILESTGTDDFTAIAMVKTVKLYEEETKEGMEDESEEENSGEVENDEHVWTSPKNAIVILEKIADAMIAKDEKNADYYRKNADAYKEKLENLDREFTEVTENAKLKTVVFAERFPFRYLTEAYSLDYYAAFKGCSSANEPTLKTISFLVDKIKEENIPVVFYIEFSTETVADKICAETGAKKLLLHSCHNVSNEDFDAGVTYVDLMEQNVKNLKEALA